MLHESSKMLRALGSVESGMAALHELRGTTQTASLLGLHGRLSEAVLLAAARHLQKKHPLLRAVISTKEECFHFFRPKATPAINIRHVWMTQADQWRAELETELNHPLKATNSLWKLALLDEPDQDDCCVVLTCHHAIVDAVSLVALLSDLVGLCDDLINAQQPRTHGRQIAPALDAFLKPAVPLTAPLQITGPAYERIAVLADRHTAIRYDTFNGVEFKQLMEVARRADLTLNSLIAGALLCAAEACGLGAQLHINTAVSLRTRTAPPIGANWIGCYIRVVAFDLELEGRTMEQVTFAYQERLKQQLPLTGYATPSVALSQLRENGRQLSGAVHFVQGVALTNHGRIHFPIFRSFKVLRYLNVANRVAGNFVVALHVTTLVDALTLSFTYATPLISSDRIAMLQRQMRLNLLEFNPIKKYES